MGLSSLSSQDIEKFLVLTEILSADIVEILENADKFVPYINATIDVDLGSQNLTTTGDILLEFGDLVSEQNPDTVDAIRMKATSSDVDVVLGVGGCFNIWNATDSVPTDNIFNVRDNGDVFITGAIDMNSNQINELTDPTANQDAATKKYVDDNDFWQRVGTVLSPKTAGDDIKVSGVTILDAAPILVFRDSNGAGAASTGFIEWKDSGGGRAGYFGNASSGDDDLSWANEQSGHIKIITTGAGELQVSAPLKITRDGSQASPALKFNDTDTGFYKLGDSVRFSLNNSTKMTINSTGVGVGTETPDTKLQVVGDCKFGDDNTNYVSIDGTGDVVFVGGAGLPFAEIYARDNTATTSTSTTKTQVLIFDTNGESNNMTPDHAQDHITATKAGKYKIDASISIKNSSGSAHVISLEMYKNDGTGVFNNIHAGRTLGTGADVGNLTMSGIVDLAANDTIEIWITSDSAAARTVTVEDINFCAIQIGGT